MGMYWALRLGLRWHLASAASKQDVTERSVFGPVVDLPSQGTGMCSASYPFGLPINSYSAVYAKVQLFKIGTRAL